MSIIKSFQPIVDRSSQVLILGSIPGVESINKSQYYANPRNHFWKIMYTIFDSNIHTEYKDKIKFLRNHKIALWDVIESCYREGSLDSKIRNECPNDFKSFFVKYPHIKYVLFNGSKAYESFQRHVGFNNYTHLIFRRLPSTSPANTIKFEDKLNEWFILREFLTK